MSAETGIIVYGMHSPNVRKVLIMLEELGTPYALRHVAVFKGEQFGPEFQAMNPLGKVPVLVDPALGRPLFESGAILVWLAERSGRFLPTDAPDRAEVMQWLMVQMASIGPMLGQLNHFQLLSDGADPYALGRYTAQAETLYRLLDDRLAMHEWIAADALTIADFAIFPWAHYLEQHGFDRADHPNLLRWRDAIDLRPSIARVSDRLGGAFARIANETRLAATPDDLDRFFGRTDRVPATDFSRVTR